MHQSTQQQKVRGNSRLPLVHASPMVGQNLLDQYLVRISHRTHSILTVNEMNNFATIALEGLKYLTQNRGLLTLGASMASLFCRSSSSAKFADLQLMFAPVSFSPSVPGALESAGGMTIGVFVTSPDSAGSVLARSSDPEEFPTIRPNYLSAPTDWPRLLVGLRTARRVFEMDALKRWSVGETTPGPGVVTDDELYDFARRVGSTAAHYAGTCRMGSEETSVTDTLLRVRGVSGLRVVDNSVLPSPVSGGMNATAIAVAERAADLIRGRLTASQGGQHNGLPSARALLRRLGIWVLRPAGGRSLWVYDPADRGISGRLFAFYEDVP